VDNLKPSFTCCLGIFQGSSKSATILTTNLGMLLYEVLHCPVDDARMLYLIKELQHIRVRDLSCTDLECMFLLKKNALINCLI
jgi:hypothetical protein